MRANALLPHVSWPPNVCKFVQASLPKLSAACRRFYVMYLKSIEIQGFKSFANKTVLLFNEGVTGIVGPNGSGKSNVADAVRWVLGEQKVKQLRGASMQDVIFAGTQFRKPLGFAYVAITLDNGDRKLPVDYAEVTVSRRLYRSGESEYLLNGQAVRLRDVQELFYDTGIGKEGYSIIGQGQIEALLSGRPEERRSLFDEAAGIVKFKHRKQIAERKLEAERANLLRITDILTELERQVGPLKKQAENASAFLKLRDELKSLDLNLFVREADEAIEKLDKLGHNINLIDASLGEVKEESEELKTSHAALSEELQRSEEHLTLRRTEIQRGELLIQNLKGQIQVAEAEIHGEESNLARCKEQLTLLSRENQVRERTVLLHLASLYALRDQLKLVAKRQAESLAAEASPADGSKDGLKQLQASQGASSQAMSEPALPAEAEEVLSRLASRISAFSKAVQQALGMEPSAFAAALEAAKAEAEEKERASHQNGTAEGVADGQSASDAEDAELDAYVEPDWLKSIRHKQDDLSAITEREERVKAWLSRSSEEYNQATLELKMLNRRISDCQEEYHRASTRLDTLRNIAERYEGYGQSVKAVMQLKARVPGIRGVVADLIKTEARYETAIETALGGSIQNIVTDSEQTAKILIEHLKKNRLGRATFLPLDALSFRESEDYRRASAEHGALGLASELVSVEPDYQKLCKYLLCRTLVAENMEAALAIARKYRHSLRIVTLEGELLSPGGSISGGAFRNTSNLMGRARELEDLKASCDAILKRVDDLNEKAAVQERIIREKSEETDAFNEELKSISLEKNTLSLGIVSEMKLQYSGISQKTEFVSENVERLTRELLDGKAAYAAQLDEQRRAADEISLRTRTIAERQENIRETAASMEAAKLEIAQLEAEKSRLSDAQKDAFSRRDALREQILSLEKEHLRLDNQREKEQQRLDNQTAYIWNEYELSLSEARPFFREDLNDAKQLQSEIASLKAKIRALGPVNLQAVEDYKELSGRYEFMSAQHKDLVESEQSIVSIIAELDAGMRRQFKEKFQQIQLEFDRVFQELFGGGHGTLELVSDADEDMLDAGIAINAQPPGKKLQNMLQLSGGEKALTAIALLFAIQSLKPSPFCLLDEIEAALDDSNVGRFAQYLHKLTRDTQFIVITHRRGTMESADRLYGITMQEKGVTTLVSVDLVSDQLS